MEIEKSVVKRITNKRFILKSENLCGRVIKGDKDVVIALFDNGVKKIYTRWEFDKLCDIQKKTKKTNAKHTESVENQAFKYEMTKRITNYINVKFKGYEIIFKKYTIDESIVYLNGNKCGKISITAKKVNIIFKAMIPPPAIAKYLTKKQNNLYTYSFTDLSRATVSDMYIAINWLLLVGKEKISENEPI